MAYILNPHTKIILYDGDKPKIHGDEKKIYISYSALPTIVALPWVARKIAKYLPREEVEEYLMRCVSDCITWPKEVEKVLVGKPISKTIRTYFIGNYPILAKYQKIVGEPKRVEKVVVKTRVISVYDGGGSITFSNFLTAIDGYTKYFDYNVKYSAVDVPAAYCAKSTTWHVIDRKIYDKYCTDRGCPWTGHNEVFPEW